MTTPAEIVLSRADKQAIKDALLSEHAAWTTYGPQDAAKYLAIAFAYLDGLPNKTVE